MKKGICPKCISDQIADWEKLHIITINVFHQDLKNGKFVCYKCGVQFSQKEAK
jgi:hypothetical protein